MAAINVHVIRCDGPPTTAPTLEGQHWIDSTTGDMWLSNGTATVANWVKILTVGALPPIKAGRLLNTDFSGSPKMATVTFTTPLPTPYAVNISSVDTRVWTVTTYTSLGFVINSNANLSLTGDVFWEVIQDGEF